MFFFLFFFKISSLRAVFDIKNYQKRSLEVFSEFIIEKIEKKDHKKNFWI